MLSFNSIARVPLSLLLVVTLTFSLKSPANNPPPIGEVLNILHECVFILGIFGPESVKRTAYENATYATIKDQCGRVLSKDLCGERERCEWKDDRCDLDEELAEIEVRLRNFAEMGWMLIAMGAFGTVMAGAGLPLLAFGIYVVNAGPTAMQLKQRRLMRIEKMNEAPATALSK